MITIGTLGKHYENIHKKQAEAIMKRKKLLKNYQLMIGSSKCEKMKNLLQ